MTPSGVIFKETPEGVTTNIWMIYFLSSPYKNPQAEAWGYTDEARLRGLIQEMGC